MSTTVLAIDSATIKSGFALVEFKGSTIKLLDWGTIQVKGALHERLNKLRARVLELAEEHEPTHVAVEDLKFNRGTPNLSSMAKVAMAVGSVNCAFAQAGYSEVESITANSVRKTWDVSQNKAALRDAINKKFINQIKDNGRPDGFKKSDEDTTDAIGLAVAVWAKLPKE